MTDVKLSEGGASGARLWLSITAVIAAGSIAFVGVVTYNMLSARRDIARIQAPGEAELTLTRADHYIVFNEFRRSDDSVGFVRPRGVQNLRINIREKASGNAIELTPSKVVQSYAIRRNYAESIYEFDAPAPGVYTVTAVHAREGEGDPLTLVIKTPGRHLILTTMIEALVILAATTLGVVVLAMRAKPRNAPA